MKGEEYDGGFVNVTGTVKGVPVFSESEVNKFCIKQMKINDFFKRRVKKMNTDLNKANDHIDEYVDVIGKNIERLVSKEDEFIQQAKKISTGIRKNSQSMVDGIVRIKKSANFDELEKYTNTLERFVSALEKLESLEKTGSLAKITGAMK